MIAVTLISVLAVAAAAQPHDHHHKRHQEIHDKRAVVTHIQTVAAPDVVVYVDQNGNALSTVTQEAQPVATEAKPEAKAKAKVPAKAAAPAPSSEAAPVPAPASSSSSSSAPAAPSPEVQAAAVPSSSPSSEAKVQSQSVGSGSGQWPLGITYTPYTTGPCKDTQGVLNDFKSMPSDYGLVRIYGVDCNQVGNVINAAKQTNKQVILGIFDIDNIEAGVETMSQGAGDWSQVKLVTVGNELVNTGQKSAGTVVNAIGTARSALRAKGYNGPVSTVDTFDAVIANPSLCEASDIATVNCHAFFTPSVLAGGAGAYVQQQSEAVSHACGGKQVLITESGWPHQGDTNGNAVPNKSNQGQAISSLKSSFGNANIVLFSAFDEDWKQSGGGQFNAEPYWGILN